MMKTINLVGQVKKDSIEALKAGNKEALSTLRLLIAEFEIEKVKHKLTEAIGLDDKQAESVIKRQIKKLDKEKEAYAKVGQSTAKQDSEIALLKTYLPEEATQEEIDAVIAHAFDLVEKGEIKSPMQYISQKLNGRADLKAIMKTVNTYKK